ncbi:MAG: winged helix-turn-helix transcriptional regulator [Candidatus Heimdallarchaeota archaeon]|nr:MAG: winged helix-turn-helix transcriptional regulator [Candidatus Heimdallarchaeota archaeon]
MTKQDFYNLDSHKNMSKTISSGYQENLQGKTLRIYSYLLTHTEAGIRELQRNLGLSSSNVVTHHIKKLIEYGLIKQNSETNKYIVVKEVKIGVLSLYTRFGRYLIPKNLFLLTFFCTMTLMYIALIIVPNGILTHGDLFFLSSTIVGVIFLIKSSYDIWRLKPL